VARVIGHTPAGEYPVILQGEPDHRAAREMGFPPNAQISSSDQSEALAICQKINERAAELQGK